MKLFQRLPALPTSALILLASTYLTITGNQTFFRKVTEVYPLSSETALFLLSLFLALVFTFHILLSLLSMRFLLKPVLTLFLVLGALTSYYTDSFGTVMDESMILNIMRTDPGEVRDLFHFGIVFRVFVFGVLPSVLVWMLPSVRVSHKKTIVRIARDLLVCFLLFIGMVAAQGKFYASFFREHKNLRPYINPVYLLYSAGRYGISASEATPKELSPLGRDAKVSPKEKERNLVILVVGETARWDRFSLNGYARPTNPLLAKENVISFSSMFSCGTSTAISVPCMFSGMGRSDYSEKKGRSSENLLDVLGHTKEISVSWRDNNSDSKGVALRVPNEDFKDPKINPLCDEECRDEGMLASLQEFVNKQTTNHILVVLHQMGNHGPAYYKRYPKKFGVFQPTCNTNQLENCTVEEIGNTYDNAILYTDYFLSQVIQFLKKNSPKFQTAMLYVSDHGESLGERGVYLHGLPYFLAPEEQRRVGAVLWLDPKRSSTPWFAEVKKARDQPTSHDAIFHTVLGLFKVETSVYDPNQDLLKPGRL